MPPGAGGDRGGVAAGDRAVNLIGAGLACSVGLTGAASAAGLALPRRSRATGVGVLTAALGAAGVVVGVAALSGRTFSACLPDVLPLAGVYLGVDALSGLFITVAGAVVLAVAVYGIGYHGHGHDPGRAASALFPLFALAMLLVPAAASVSTFLVCWELMAVTSLLLVLTEHRRREQVREAGLWYAVMTQLGFVLILFALVWLAAAAHGETFAAIRAAAGHLSPAVRGTVFVLALVGFGSKAGIVPLHAWLPRAHPEAPSPVSALMSAVMVNLGVYGLIRVGMGLLGGGPRWWWLLAMAAGAVSAVYGILQASVTSDLKRLLAYSTTENMGLIVLGVGAAGLFGSAGKPQLAGIALAAALLHVVTHSAFKALLFAGAGSVLRATGTRDLDALGGLRQAMPVTTAAFAVGALGAAALPGGAGFVSEWLLLQSLIHGLAVPGIVVSVVLPIAVAAVALSAGLAVATFVKALGTGFLARPRSDGAARAAESPATMLAAMLMLAGAATVLAVAPGLAGSWLARAVAGVTPVGPAVADAVRTKLTVLGSTMSPLVVVAGTVGVTVVLAGLLRLVVGVRRRAVPLWDCGAGPPSARMQYTATSFAEPLQRVFDDVLAPESDVDVTPVVESAYLVERVSYHRVVPDRIEHRLYAPVLIAVRWCGERARALANGSVHRYLGYAFSSLVILLVALAAVK
ncbi:MAG: hydrogenase 4 subunit B [Catenulispora sp.]|nr:hydrogenase 4 subunit B [Catenulispora sp.]NUR60036.1 hydrogenase 4 subunit B [Catenulispora sp.]